MTLEKVLNNSQEREIKNSNGDDVGKKRATGKRVIHSRNSDSSVNKKKRNQEKGFNRNSTDV